MKTPTPPLCSIVIPNHNCLIYLKQAVESVRQQTFQHWELIVADDRSTDGSKDWLLQVAAEDPRIRPVDVNGGNPAKARNQGIAAARTELIALLDADDLWLPDKLEKQVSYHLRDPQTVLSFSDYRHVNEAGIDLGTCFEYWQPKSLRDHPISYQVLTHASSALFAQNLVGTSTVMFRLAAFQKVGGFDEQLRSAEDWDLWLKLTQLGPVAVCNSVSMLYLMRAGSETSKTDDRIASLKIIFQRYSATIETQHRSALRMARARIVRAVAEQRLQQCRWYKALWSNLHALCLNPNKRQLCHTLDSLKRAILQLS